MAEKEADISVHKCHFCSYILILQGCTDNWHHRKKYGNMTYLIRHTYNNLKYVSVSKALCFIHSHMSRKLMLQDKVIYLVFFRKLQMFKPWSWHATIKSWKLFSEQSSWQVLVLLDPCWCYASQPIHMRPILLLTTADQLSCFTAGKWLTGNPCLSQWCRKPPRMSRSAGFQVSFKVNTCKNFHKYHHFQKLTILCCTKSLPFGKQQLFFFYYFKHLLQNWCSLSWQTLKLQTEWAVTGTGQQKQQAKVSGFQGLTCVKMLQLLSMLRHLRFYSHSSLS